MGVVEDIKKMREEGNADQEIVRSLQAKGLAPKEIYDGISQANIKNAVIESPESSSPNYKGYSDSVQENELQPSLSSSSQEAPNTSQYQEQQPAQQKYSQYPSQPAQQEYYDPNSYQGISADMISEIAEQVMNEKLSALRNDLEKVINIKTTFESKADILDERLKRIEKIIDRLQLSILQKVGDYMTNIDDIKKELIETQKSFKSLSSAPETPKPKASKVTEE